MNEYEVTITLSCTYRVAGVDENVAAMSALEMFDEAKPDITVKKVYDAETDTELG